MRNFVRVLVAATSMLAAVSVIHPTGAKASAQASAESDARYVEQLLFDTSLVTFVHIAQQRLGPDGRPGDTWFDWSTDGCSAPLVGDTGRTFDFTGPCRRHDFGYRNTQLLAERYGSRAWNGEARHRIDRQFLADMKHHCRHRWLADRPTCLAWAYTFYEAVRVGGGP